MRHHGKPPPPSLAKTATLSYVIYVLFLYVFVLFFILFLFYFVLFCFILFYFVLFLLLNIFQAVDVALRAAFMYLKSGDTNNAQRLLGTIESPIGTAMQAVALVIGGEDVLQKKCGAMRGSAEHLKAVETYAGKLEAAMAEWTQLGDAIRVVKEWCAQS